ncbi:hypothetical protein CL634_01435 [bacterium]|nr:hypothetical protein [bacterium]
MPLYKFKPNDIFHNRIKVHPKQIFHIYYGNATSSVPPHASAAILNNKIALSGAFTDKVRHIPPGHVSAYEINIDRSDSADLSENQLIYPFITKTGSRLAFKTISLVDFNNFAFGDVITGSYPLSASISKLHFIEDQDRPHVSALSATLNYYTPLSLHYRYSSNLGDKGSEQLGLLSVPSIFYGSSIKKGSVDLKFYLSGNVVGHVQDTKQNGELIEVSGANADNTGKVAGVVLYNEGFLILTGSWDLSPGAPGAVRLHQEIYSELGLKPPSWVYFGQSMSGTISTPSSSYTLEFQGTDYVPTITMLAHAPKGMFNHSNNPTYPKYNSNRVFFATGAYGYQEPKDVAIKNLVSSSYKNHTASFEKHTYISKIGIYDKDRNLIGIAKLATPVKKTENRDFTFKLKLDI